MAAFIKAILFLGIIQFATLTFAESDDPSPIVYSGIFHNSENNRDYLVRVHFINVSEPDSKYIKYNAIVIIHLGSDDTPSYVSLNYDAIGTLRSTREIVMPGLTSPNADHLPILRFKFDEAGINVTGTMTSREESGEHGTFRLSLGWDFKATGPVVQPVAGLYEAQCSDATDGSGLRLSHVEIVTSRFDARSVETAFALNRILFRGIGICNYNGPKNCMTIDAGHYRLLHDAIEFWHGNWKWDCERPDQETLQCKTNYRYANCTLKRKSTLPMVARSPNVDFKVIPIQWDNVANISAGSSATTIKEYCDKWNGDYNGQLTHRLGGKQQPVTIQIRAYLQDRTEDVNGQVVNEPICGMLVSAVTRFYTYDPKGEKIAFAFSRPQVLQMGADVVHLNDARTDLMLTLKLMPGGKTVKGIWNSRVYGVVGEWEATENVPYPLTTNDRAVYGISGFYTLAKDRHSYLTIGARDLGASINLLDPFGAIQVSGWRQFSMQGPSGLMPSPFRQPIGSAFYDYFTNYFAFFAGPLYFGYVSASGLTLNYAPLGYLGFVQTNFATPMVFSRQTTVAPQQ